MGLTIAIDYDKTWTAAPIMWGLIADLIRSRGHDLICVTGRAFWSSDMNNAPLRKWMPVVYAAGEFKERAALKEGYKVDIWIDDMPGTIQECKILKDNLE